MKTIIVWMALAALAGQTRAEGPAGEATPLGKSFAQAGFDAIAREQGVAVFKDERSEIIRIGAEATLADSPEAVMGVLLDYDHQVGRVDRLSVSRVLERGPDQMLVYQRLNLPVIDDRDFNLEVRWGEREGRAWIHWQASPRGVPPQPGVVRVTDHEGSWQLEPTADGRFTRARFQARLDVAGLVPRWLVRSGAGDQMPEFFGSIRRMLIERTLLGGGPCTSSSC